MKAPKPPKPDDANYVASSQTQSNVDTAIANTALQNANEINPYGSVNYKVTSHYSKTVPVYNKDGEISGWRVERIPIYTKTTQLSAAQQKLLDQQNALGFQMNDIAGTQLKNLKSTLSTPISTNGLPQVQNSLNAPQLNRNIADAGQIQKQIGADDFSGDRQRVEDAIYSRMEPAMQRDRLALENRLRNQGVVSGSQAWREAMDESNRAATDARMQAILAGGQEQSRLFGMDQAQGSFANTAQAQQFEQNMGRSQFGNQAQLQQFDAQKAAAEYGQTARERALQERMTIRNQPINEISALMNGGQVTVPQFAQFNPGNIAGTDYAGINANNFNQRMQAYNAQQANRSSMMGGVGSILGMLPGFFGGL